jgi:hypothetical protein
VSISCLGSERELASSSPCVVVHRDDEHGTTVQENDDGWSSDGVVLWLGRMQNRDAVEWWREWPRLI